MAIIQILLAQLTILWREPTRNLERLQELLAPYEGDLNRLLVVPEMMSTGFSDEIEDLVEPHCGPWESTFHGLITEKSLPTLLGIARRRADGVITNDCLFLHPGEDAPRLAYEKVRPFRSEHKVVTPGRKVMTFDYQGIRICPLICYDLRFPELFRAGLQQGAEVFIVMASWPDPRHFHWETLLQARAIENQAYVIGVNRCGDDPNFHYAGGSMVVDPLGKVVYHAGDTESIHAVSIDVQQVRDWRETFPAAKDYLTNPSVGT